MAYTNFAPVAYIYTTAKISIQFSAISFSLKFVYLFYTQLVLCLYEFLTFLFICHYAFPPHSTALPPSFWPG